MRIHSLWSTRAGAFCAGVLLSLVLTGAILENARANDVPPPPTRVPETLRMQIDSLTAQVGALQTQVGSLQSQINNVWASAQATAQQTSANIQSLQGQFQNHTHTITMPGAIVPCSALQTFQV